MITTISNQIQERLARRGEETNPIASNKNAQLRGLCIVHVAATRARVELLVTSTPALAAFLGNLANTENV